MFFKITAFIIVCVMSSIAPTSCSSATTEPEANSPVEVLIELPYPDEPAELSLAFELPGMIRLIGYSGSDFVSGSVQTSYKSWAPETGVSGNKANITQTAKAKLTENQEFTNLWKLRISDNRSFGLEIRNKQAEGHWNLSGLPVTDLFAELGAVKNAFTFDEVNPAVMQKCELKCSTGEVVFEGILNAVCENMTVQAGEGSLSLRFGGKELLRDMNVNIRAGSGTINLSFPSDIPASVTVGAGNRVIFGDGVNKTEDCCGITYTTGPYNAELSKAVHVSISSGDCVIYLNPPPSSASGNGAIPSPSSETTRR
jgi:hypothetical protein